MVAFKEYVISIVEVKDVHTSMETSGAGSNAALGSSPTAPTPVPPLPSSSSSSSSGAASPVTSHGMEDKWCFEIVTYDKRYLLGVGTAKEKNEWLQDLRTVISEVSQSDPFGA
eukprot:TRINITY_DN3613_c0_g2_i3.p1 TRINITY_DN3613_c0_g2~~TRINITY_DN3613_c0_g2_i3.p1  ORF type:complete len:113 (+),score=15.30 TRINITY_DN3613_c0_g2_i3:683-1021(+)